MEHDEVTQIKKSKSDPLKEKSFQLAIRVVRLYRYLTEDKKEFVVSKQLLRAGTNPGAMIREAANAESSLDFVHKLGVAQKETGETQYWLELLFATNFLTENEYDSIYADTEEVMKLLRSSILTKKRKIAAQAGAIVLLLATTLLFF